MMFQRIPVKHMQRQVGLGCAIGSEMAGPSRHDGKNRKHTLFVAKKHFDSPSKPRVAVDAILLMKQRIAPMAIFFQLDSGAL
jgi:hypothetical protein